MTGLALLPQDSPGTMTFKKRGLDREETHSLSIVFANSRCRTLPLSAKGIRADERACTLARDGELREKACS